jgi:2OG-Fe(II) oxygenase superfamily
MCVNLCLPGSLDQVLRDCEANPVDSIADGIWITGELLKPAECDRLLTLSHKNGYREASMKFQGRHNSESFLLLPEIAQTVESRLNSEIRCGNVVRLHASVLSSTLRFYLYEQGDHVTPHCDAPEHVKDGRWSTFTLIIYLNDGFTGGTTGFPELGVEICAPAGQGVLFDQSLLHEANQVLTGEKCIVVTRVATVS